MQFLHDKPFHLFVSSFFFLFSFLPMEILSIITSEYFHIRRKFRDQWADIIKINERGSSWGNRLKMSIFFFTRIYKILRIGLWIINTQDIRRYSSNSHQSIDRRRSVRCKFSIMRVIPVLWIENRTWQDFCSLVGKYIGKSVAQLTLVPVRGNARKTESSCTKSSKNRPLNFPRSMVNYFPESCC